MLVKNKRNDSNKKLEKAQIFRWNKLFVGPK